MRTKLCVFRGGWAERQGRERVVTIHRVTEPVTGRPEGARELRGEGTPLLALPRAWRGVDAQAVPGTRGRLPGGSVHLLGLERREEPAKCSVARGQVPLDSETRQQAPSWVLGAWSCPPAEAQGLPPCEYWSLGTGRCLPGGGVSLSRVGSQTLRAAPRGGRAGGWPQEQAGAASGASKRRGCPSTRDKHTGCEPWGTCLGTWALGPESTLGSSELLREPPAAAREKRGPREGRGPLGCACGIQGPQKY